MRKGKTSSRQANFENNKAYIMWFNRLYNVVLNLYKYSGMPDEIDIRFYERMLIENGGVFFTKEDVVDRYIALPGNMNGKFDIYGNPTRMTIYSPYTSYTAVRENNINGIYVFNNYTRTTVLDVIDYYAFLLSDITRTIQVNSSWQKTPALIRTTKDKELSVKNALLQIQGNEKCIVADKEMYEDSLFVDNIDVPYVGDKMMVLKRQILNEFYTWFGIENNDSDKKERLVSMEVHGNDGAIEMSRNTMLDARREGLDRINRMYGLDISVEFNSDMNTFINGGIDATKESFEDEEFQNGEVSRETSDMEEEEGDKDS